MIYLVIDKDNLREEEEFELSGPRRRFLASSTSGSRLFANLEACFRVGEAGEGWGLSELSSVLSADSEDCDDEAMTALLFLISPPKSC